MAFCLLGFTSHWAKTIQPLPLFIPAAAPANDPVLTTSKGIAATSYVSLNVAALAAGSAETVLFNVPELPIYTLQRISGLGNEASFVWTGSAQEVPGSLITLNYQNGVLSGTGKLVDVNLSIRYVSDGIHAVDRLAPVIFFGEGTPPPDDSIAVPDLVVEGLLEVAEETATSTPANSVDSVVSATPIAAATPNGVAVENNPNSKKIIQRCDLNRWRISFHCYR